MERGRFDGRRNNKRIKAIEKYKEKILGEFTTEYERSQEMKFLREETGWEGTAELILVMAMRDVHFAWKGLRDYGFLRLCKRYIEQNEIEAMTPKDAETMIRSILTEAMWDELDEELSGLEIF